MIVNWHAHVIPPEKAAAPAWQGRCPMTIENLLRIHEAAGVDLAVVSNTIHYLKGEPEHTDGETAAMIAAAIGRLRGDRIERLVRRSGKHRGAGNHPGCGDRRVGVAVVLPQAPGQGVAGRSPQRRDEERRHSTQGLGRRRQEGGRRR